MSDRTDDILFDTRVMPFAQRRNQISFKEIDDRLAGLPDDAEHAEEMDVRFATPFGDRMEKDAAEE